MRRSLADVDRLHCLKISHPSEKESKLNFAGLKKGTFVLFTVISADYPVPCRSDGLTWGFQPIRQFQPCWVRAVPRDELADWLRKVTQFIEAG